MPHLVEILFPEGDDDGVLVHRIRNFGEDLWKESVDSEEEEFQIDLGEVDSAETRLALVVCSPQFRDSVLAFVRRTLEKHKLYTIAEVRETVT